MRTWGRLTGALRDLGAVERGTGLLPDVQGLHSMETTCWRSPFGDVDTLLGIPDKSQYERAQYKQLSEDAGALVIAGVLKYMVMGSRRCRGGGSRGRVSARNHVAPS